MAITYPLTLPASPGLRRAEIAPIATIGISVNPFTQAQELFEHDGELWRVDVEVPAMTRAQAAAWLAWRLSLRGALGTFTMGIPGLGTPRGTPAGTPVVDGAGQLASKTLATRGWTPSAANVLRAGDLIQLGSGSTARLHMALADVSADGSGEATIDVFPKIRTALADGAAIVTTACVGLWRMADNAMPWSIDEAQEYGLSFSALEAL